MVVLSPSIPSQSMIYIDRTLEIGNVLGNRGTRYQNAYKDIIQESTHMNLDCFYSSLGNLVFVL
jgi:hypothetical protein